jgi:Peptidase S46
MKTQLILFSLLTIVVSSLGCSKKSNDDSCNLKAVKTTKLKTDIKAVKTNSNTINRQSNLLDPPPSGEGMWPWFDLHKLNEKSLKKRGLKLTLKEIWTKNKGGVASAVVGMHGCTASFISPDGLLITNHHCAFRAIQRNSTKEKNLLKNGFQAKTQKEELNGFGTKIYLFQSQKDVTSEIIGKIPKTIKDQERFHFIETKEKLLVKKCEMKKNRKCFISRENNGLRFLLLENIELDDVRLVAAPPQAIGSYGGEIDNWHWPRHTLDFSIMRAYVAKDGSPAKYSKTNIPYKPKKYLKTSLKGISQGEMVMVLGTPYRTSRYTIHSDLKHKIEWYYPLRVDVFSEWVAILEDVAQKFSDSKIPLQTMIKRLHNGLTNSKGQITGIKRNLILQKKLSEEKKWKKWVTSNKGAKKEWLTSLENLNKFYNSDNSLRTHDFLLNYLLYSVKTLSFARTITKLATEKTKKDMDREPGYMKRDVANIMERLEHAQKNLSLEADRRLFIMFIGRLGKLPEKSRLKWLNKELKGDYSKLNIEKFVNKSLKSSKLFSKENRMKIAVLPLDQLKKSNDPLIKIAFGLYGEIEAYNLRKKTDQGTLFRLLPTYLESLISFKGVGFYPDANRSPRISFAQLWGYSPKDGVWHIPFTTLSGMIAKFTGKAPFELSSKVISLNKKSDSKYSDPNLKDIPICFLSNADTTGGNSGSPALNGKGEIIGLNFDRVYENISGDYGYNIQRSRNIMADIRGILWYMDRIMGAANVISEIDSARKK